jgi:hypothetical protein
MATKKLPPSKPRNVTVIAMMKRYGRTTTVMKDRRQVRGGTRNKSQDFLAGNY